MTNPEISRGNYPAGDYSSVREKLKEKPVIFLDEKPGYSFDELENIRQQNGGGVLYVCDFAIKGVEAYEKNGYFQNGDIINLDHHSEAGSMKRFVSSTNLVIDYIKNNPDFNKSTYQVLTHHVDCDSILATLILRGVLPPEERFGIAAIAADHTGEENDIADLLQAIKRGPQPDETPATAEVNRERSEYVLKNLELFLQGKPLETSAQMLLEKRLEQRESVKNVKDSGKFGHAGKKSEVIFLPTEANSRLDPTLLIGQFSDAKVIFTHYLTPSGNYIYNVRLGKNAEPGTDLRVIMKKAGLEFGGRWNGGANKRSTNGEGVGMAPEEYAVRIADIL